MKKTNRRLRNIFRWIAWVILLQFILINISASLYAYKLTHFYDPGTTQPATKNIFSKTWKLFTGPNFEKMPVSELPNIPYETVQLVTKENKHIEAWYIPVDSAKGTVILFHGLGLNKSSLLEQTNEFRFFGFNTLLVDLRAHGNSEGNTTTLGVRESEEAKLGYDFVSAKGEKNIVLYGMSLGAVVVMKSIYDYGLKPSRIIIDAPFISLRKHLQGRARALGFPNEPFATLVTFWISIERGFNGFREDISAYAEKINCPVLMQSGAFDKWVYTEDTKEIFEHLATRDKKLLSYENAGHESFLRKDVATWRKEVGEFLFKK
jgi:alpha-beta hydrolase superfamily lysophospholipase